ncbi:MAG TPA: 5-amino-6-(D-ribitylamino)uracil--L-tyrosine 4-hydroxyphenyl transferase CofH [Dehalococcoidia bacterium]
MSLDDRPAVAVTGQKLSWPMRLDPARVENGAAERLLPALTPAIARILDRSLGGEEITVDEGETLFATSGIDLQALCIAADELRRAAVGDTVTYVVNRNINFTNVCIKHCGFCAFSRDHRTEEGYFLPEWEIVRRARQAWDLGATEVCVQAGLPPKMEGRLYVDLTKALKRELPDLHIHGFSPEEVLYGSVRSRVSIAEYVGWLAEAGVGSLPGTSAEILDDKVRHQIAPGRITTAQWIEVAKAAHAAGVPTTSTIMYGHLETLRHRAAHIALLRDIQRETGGFTEFVPLSFVHTEAPMWQKGLVQGMRGGPTGQDVMKMYAVSRIMLNGFIPNIQVSWVKEGTRLAQLGLLAGGNDVGGTLINESISTSAGAGNGQLVRPAELRRIVRDLGRVPAERSTLYTILRVFHEEPEVLEPLDDPTLDTEQFGSYARLTQASEFRFVDHRDEVTAAR